MTAAWPSVPLGEVLRRVERFERRDDTAEYRFAGTYSFARGIFTRPPVAGSSFRLGDVQRVRSGDFVYCKIMAWEGAFGIVPSDADDHVMSGAFVAYEPQLERIVPAYLDWYFKIPHVWQYVGRHSTGTNVRRRSLHPTQFESATIPLPPLPEQRRIVVRIEELAGKVGEAISLRRQAITERDALTGSAVATLLRAAQGSGCLGDYVVDCSYGTSRKTDDDDTGTPVLRMGNIQQGRLDLRNLKYLHLDSSERAKLLLEPGDIVVNRTNSADLVGKCAVFDLDSECSFASYLIRLRLDTERADPRLVAAWVNSPAGRAYMFNERKQMTGQANVNATKLKALPTALPDLAVQRRIVAELDSLQAKVDELKRLQAETQAELDALLPSILDRAFKGEL